MYTFKSSKAGLEGSLGTILSNSFLFPDEEVGAQREGPGPQPPPEEGAELGLKPEALLSETHHFQGPFPWPVSKTLQKRGWVYC